MSLSRGMDKQTIVCFTMEYILWAIKKEQTIDTLDNLDESQIHGANRKNPNSKGSILHDSIYMTFGKKQNYITQIRLIISKGLG